MPILNHHHIANKFYISHNEREGLFFDNYVFNVNDGDVIPVDDYASLKVIETPGHLDDHICFLL